MSDFLSGLISASGYRIFVKWREKARGRKLEQGGDISAPCALRVIGGKDERWKQGKMLSEGTVLTWKPRSGSENVAFRPGVRILAERKPTVAESWLINHSLVILRVYSDDEMIEVALPPTEANRFREILGFSAG